MFEIGDPSLDELESLGVLSRSLVSHGGRASERDLIRFHLAAFEDFDSVSPGRWSLASIPGAGAFLGDDMVKDGGLSVRLINAIPLPGREVPFEDLLEFREHRRSELLALRAHLDRLGQTIVSAPDTQRALVAALDDLDRTINDQIRTVHERFGLPRLVGFDVGFSITDAAKAGFPSAGAALAAGLPLSTAALSGLGAGALAGVSAEFRPGWRKSREGRPFEYVVHIHEQLG